jgi:hypothetical protein
MEAQTSTGPYSELVQAYSSQDMAQLITIGLTKEFYLKHTRLGLLSFRGQFYGIVRAGMVLAQHCFQGLQRPLMHLGDMQADQSVSVYTWKPYDNYEWIGDSVRGTIIRLAPPSDSVFAVLVREQPPDTIGVSGCIARWNWIKEDSELAGAPIDWQIRYNRKLWSKEAQ